MDELIKKEPRYLLIGGSNCVLKNGFGDNLQKQLQGEWRNESLGNSSSLRGVEFLQNNMLLCDWADYIFFEYTLNDLIFETSNTLDPIIHLKWLQSLIFNETIRKKIIFIILHGQAALPRISTSHSFVFDNYNKVIEQFNISNINLFPLIKSMVSDKGMAGVFKDNDHFNHVMVQCLVKGCIQSFVELKKGAKNLNTFPSPSLELVRINPIKNAIIKNATICEFKTSLLTIEVLRLNEESEIIIQSPGGILVGFYGVVSTDAGFICFNYQNKKIIKSMRHRFGVSKPYLRLCHLTTPIYTKKGEDIIVQSVNNINNISNAYIDNTLAQVVNNTSSNYTDVGGVLFLVSNKGSIGKYIETPSNRGV